MAIVTIYTTPLCGFCIRAKRLLIGKGVEFEEIGVKNSSAREKMIERSNGVRTVPQIFIDDVHVGGSDELHQLEAAGKLDEMLNSSGEALKESMPRGN